MDCYNYSRIMQEQVATTKKSKTTIVVGIIGFPNVGKSSIINALKRCRAVGVSSRPGFTTSMQEVVLDKTVRLLDSPGVVFSDEENSTLLGNCLDASSMKDPIPAVTAILERCNVASLIMTYNIPAFPPGNVMMFLAMVARSQGKVLKGGVPNKIAAARSVLRDWNSGKIPYYTTVPKEDDSTTTTSSTKHADAVVVSKFAKEFDALDQQVLGSLKDDKDEMDFVQMTATTSTKGTSSSTEAEMQAAKFLAKPSNSNDDDSDEEMAEALPSANLNRAQLADAEDYDFDDL
uniref:G domain-containing protein n=1 Tax=Grammatophora oceanica TaxID=210454 RepID=A0A7S1Y2R0_9STRA|mmetsp:Transcript_13441/g.19783  ORF Transcript_13441/g.19783 Transcript_13441/m.19783 type:complete len:290 (+) Transcript_13441:763-1632(+)